jgi:hypothetical protein
MNEEELRCWFAGCALVGLTMRGEAWGPDEPWEIADELIAIRNIEPEQEIGIVAAKPKRKTKNA